MTLSRGERILLVDDHPKLLRSLTFLLTLAGFEVLPASDGAAALDLLRQHTPDLILCDIEMPGLSGYDVMHTARALIGPVPVVLMSSRYGYDDLMQALDQGADDFLPKPFDFSDVMLVLRRTLINVKEPERVLVPVRRAS